MEKNLLKMLNNKHEVDFVILILFPLTPKGRVDVQMELTRWAWLEQTARETSEHLV